MDESVLGGAVQELNKLTLITDMEFGRFAEALQQGLAASLAGRPGWWSRACLPAGSSLAPPGHGSG